MTNLLDTMAVAASGMRAQATRLRHVAENIANADTPGYRRKSVPFEATDLGASEVSPGLSGVRTGKVQLDRSDLRQVFDPGHPLADDQGNYLGSNVRLIFEVADSREAQRSYEANLKMFDQARKMSAGALDLLRR